MGKFFISFGADMKSSVPIDNKNKDPLIPSEGLTQEFDDTTLTVEAKYYKDFRINNLKIKKKTGLKGTVKNFSFDFNPIDTNNILDFLRYLMKRI